MPIELVKAKRNFFNFIVFMLRLEKQHFCRASNILC